MVLCGMFKVLDIFYNPTLICTFPQLCRWPVLRASWSWWWRLLGGDPCLVVLQTPFRGISEQVYIYQDHVTDLVTVRLHTGGLYLTNYVTSEDIWLHQIWGLHRKGGEYICTHHISVLNWKNNVIFFFILLHQFGLFCVCPLHEIQIKNQIKLQVVMQQNIKNAKVDEYFCNALYLPTKSAEKLGMARPGLMIQTCLTELCFFCISWV
jgi:hypothetical protein